MEQSTESGIRRDTDVRPYAPLDCCYASHHYAERVSSTNSQPDDQESHVVPTALMVRI